jgi:hypothetical protein
MPGKPSTAPALRAGLTPAPQAFTARCAGGWLRKGRLIGPALCCVKLDAPIGWTKETRYQRRPQFLRKSEAARLVLCVFMGSG